ncbi:MAG: hypothetical protein WKG07_36420 [Hymenobacter sp.]
MPCTRPPYPPTTRQGRARPSPRLAPTIPAGASRCWRARRRKSRRASKR